MIRFPESPFPKGFSQFLLTFNMSSTEFNIFSGSCPAKIFEFTKIVSGLSVFSRNVTQGIFKIQASS